MTFDLEPDLDNANVGKYFVFYREYTYIGCSLFLVAKWEHHFLSLKKSFGKGELE